MTEAPGHTAPHKTTKGPTGKQNEAIQKPKAGTTASQRLRDAPLTLHVPRGGLKGK